MSSPSGLPPHLRRKPSFASSSSSVYSSSPPRPRGISFLERVQQQVVRKPKRSSSFDSLPDLSFSSPSSSTFFASSSPSQTPPDSPLSKNSDRSGLDLLLSAVDVAHRKQTKLSGAWEASDDLDDEDNLVHIDDDDDETEDEMYPPPLARPSMIHSRPARLLPMVGLPPIRRPQFAPLPRKPSSDHLRRTPGVSIVAAKPPVILVHSISSTSTCIAPDSTSVKRKRHSELAPIVEERFSHPEENSGDVADIKPPLKKKPKVAVRSFPPAGKENHPRAVDIASVNAESPVSDETPGRKLSVTAKLESNQNPPRAPKTKVVVKDSKTPKPRQSSHAELKSISTPLPPLSAPSPRISVDEMTPLLIQALAFTKLSALSAPDLVKLVRTDHPHLLLSLEEEGPVQAALDEGVCVGFFGKIERKGKGADGKKLHDTYFYDSRRDPDTARAQMMEEIAAAAGGGSRRRKAKMGDRTYFYEPIDMNRWVIAAEEED